MLRVFPHPTLPAPGVDVLYLDSLDELDRVPPALRALLGPRAEAAFRDPASLASIATGATAGFQRWLAQVTEEPPVLAIVSAGADSAVDEHGNLGPGRALLTFPDPRERGKEPWNLHGAIALHMDAEPPIVSIPSPLRAVVALGRIYSFGWFGSGSTCVVPISQSPPGGSEYWRELAADFPAAPIEELVAFYESSGTYLLFDRRERVWIAGIEHGGIDEIRLPLVDVVERLFSARQPPRTVWTLHRP